jgi:ferric-dicitrate binding protein FerR (iron transport regulator)
VPDKDVPWLLLERYYAGSCTPEEQAALDSWLAGDPRRRLLVERLRTVFSETPPSPDRADIERAWTQFTTSIKPTSIRAGSFRALIAAGALALLGAAWLIARYATRK